MDIAMFLIDFNAPSQFYGIPFPIVSVRLVKLKIWTDVSSEEASVQIFSFDESR